MLRPCVHFLTGIACLLISASAGQGAELPLPVEDTLFLSGFRFRVVPDAQRPRRVGHCVGVLSEYRDGMEFERWSRCLVNDWEPLDAFVSPTGRHVVTIGDSSFERGFSVVIYDSEGELLRVHPIESLKIVEPGHRSYVHGWDWTRGAIAFFASTGARFFIRLSTEQVLIFDFEHNSGDLVAPDQCPREEWARMQSFIKERTATLALAMLDSSEPVRREAGAIALGQIRCRAAIPKLEKLLEDPSYLTQASMGGNKSSVEVTNVYYVREAAIKALWLIAGKRGADSPSGSATEAP